MSTTTDPNLEPGGLLDDNGNYILQHKDVYDLMKYVWTGLLLPTDMAAYKTRVHLTEPDFDSSLQPGIKDLIKNYGVIAGNCKMFKDKTYPEIVSLAADVKSYATDVGGDKDTSYYAVIIDQCGQLDDELKKPNPDPAKVEEYKANIQGIVDMQLKTIQDYQTKATAATQALRDFEEQTKKDQSNLYTTKEGLDSILKGPGGEIETLEKDIQDKLKELEEDQEEYEQDVIIACTTLTYCWVPIVGNIAAATVAGIYGDKAVKMLAAIEAIEKLLKEENAKLATDKKIVAEMALVTKDMTSVLDLIAPAITAIEKMMGVWDDIANQLKSIYDFVQNKETQGTEFIRKLNQDKIVGKWNDLARAVGQYQGVAYISPDEKDSLEDYAKELGDAIDNSKKSGKSGPK